MQDALIKLVEQHSQPKSRVEARRWRPALLEDTNAAAAEVQQNSAPATEDTSGPVAAEVQQDPAKIGNKEDVAMEIVLEVKAKATAELAPESEGRFVLQVLEEDDKKAKEESGEIASSEEAPKMSSTPLSFTRMRRRGLPLARRVGFQEFDATHLLDETLQGEAESVKEMLLTAPLDKMMRGAALTV